MPSQENQILDNLNLSSFFDEAKLDFDLREGVIWNPAKTRVCVLSHDMLSGIYNGLYEEAGEGWKLIFTSCGKIWGARMAQRLDKECLTILGKRVGDLPLEHFIRFFSEYFVFHGWGSLSINLDSAKESGLVEATLDNSIFAEVVTDPEEMADPMLAGIMASFIGYLGGTSLDCIQTQCVTKGAPNGKFIVTIPERLENAEDLIRSGKKHEELMSLL